MQPRFASVVFRAKSYGAELASQSRSFSDVVDFNLVLATSKSTIPNSAASGGDSLHVADTGGTHLERDVVLELVRLLRRFLWRTLFGRFH